MFSLPVNQSGNRSPNSVTYRWAQALSLSVVIPKSWLTLSICFNGLKWAALIELSSAFSSPCKLQIEPTIVLIWWQAGNHTQDWKPARYSLATWTWGIPLLLAVVVESVLDDDDVTCPHWPPPYNTHSKTNDNWRGARAHSRRRSSKGLFSILSPRKHSTPNHHLMGT